MISKPQRKYGTLRFTSQIIYIPKHFQQRWQTFTLSYLSTNKEYINRLEIQAILLNALRFYIWFILHSGPLAEASWLACRRVNQGHWLVWWHQIPEAFSLEEKKSWLTIEMKYPCPQMLWPINRFVYIYTSLHAKSTWQLYTYHLYIYTAYTYPTYGTFKQSLVECRMYT